VGDVGLGDLDRLVLLRPALGPFVLEALLFEPQLLLTVANRGRFLELLRLDDRLFLLLDLANLVLDLADLRRRQRRLQRTRDAASSIRSTALSGRKRSEM
jgi:hypothetical protein